MRDEALLALREERDALHVVLSAKDDTISALRAQVAVLKRQVALLNVDGQPVAGS